MTNRKIEYWVIPPKADAEFAACMEEVLETYAQPYDPASPVLCMDRTSYWHVKPGQVTRVVVLGAGSKSYDTNGMLLEKHREDIFRHWFLGLGSGDIEIRTTGATTEHIDITNVLFIGSKIELMQELIAEEPNAS